MKFEIVKEVKRSDGLWRFACGDVFRYNFPVKGTWPLQLYSYVAFNDSFCGDFFVFFKIGFQCFMRLGYKAVAGLLKAHFISIFTTFTCNCSNQCSGGWSWRYEPRLHKPHHPQHWRGWEKISFQTFSFFAQKPGSHLFLSTENCHLLDIL